MTGQHQTTFKVILSIQGKREFSTETTHFFALNCFDVFMKNSSDNPCSKQQCTMLVRKYDAIHFYAPSRSTMPPRPTGLRARCSKEETPWAAQYRCHLRNS